MPVVEPQSDVLPTNIEYILDTSKVPPKEQWQTILQTILPDLSSYSDRSIVIKKLRALTLSNFNPPQQQFILFLLADADRRDAKTASGDTSHQSQANETPEAQEGPENPSTPPPSADVDQPQTIENDKSDISPDMQPKSEPEAPEATKSEAETLADALEERYLIKGAEGADPKEIAVQNLHLLLQLRQKAFLGPDQIEAYNILLNRLNVTLDLRNIDTIVTSGNQLDEGVLLMRLGLSPNWVNFSTIADNIESSQLLLAIQRIDKTIAETNFTDIYRKKACLELREKLASDLDNRRNKELTSQYERELTSTIAAIANATELDTETKTRIKGLLENYPEAYRDILTALRLDLSNQTDETRRGLGAIMESSKKSYSYSGDLQSDILEAIRNTDPIVLNDAFHLFHLNGGNSDQENFFHTAAAFKAAVVIADNLNLTIRLKQYLSVLNNNGLFPNRQYGFQDQLDTKAQAPTVSDEIMQAQFSNWSEMTPQQKSIAQAEIDYVQNFTEDDFNRLRSGSEQVRLLQVLFRGNRLHLIKDPKVRGLVASRLLELFNPPFYKRKTEDEQ